MNYLRTLILFLFFNLYLSASAENLEKISLQLNWKYQFEFAGFIAAKEKGFYKEKGLNVDIKEFNHNTNVLEAIKSGEVNYGIYDLSLIKLFDEKQPLMLIANYFKRSALIFIANQDVLTPKDLIGKTIMAAKVQVTESTLSTMLKKFDVKLSDFTLKKHNFHAEDFIEGRVDVMSAYMSNELYHVQKSKKPFTIIDPQTYGIYGSGVNIFSSKKETEKNPERTKKFIEATNKGWLYALEHKEEIIDLIYSKYSKLKSKDALSFEAQQVEKLIMPSIYNIGEINKELLERNIKEFINDGMIKKPLNIDSVIFDIKKDKNYKPLFSVEEEEFLNTKKEITMCIDPNWMPYEKIEKGKHIGMTAHFIPLMSKKIGLPIKLIPTTSWAQSTQYAKKRNCDIFSLAMPTPLRLKYMNFTKPYISFPVVIATTMDKLFIEDIQDIITKEKIGIVKGYSIAELLKAKYPNNKIVEVNNLEDGMKMVSKGELFGFLGALPTVAYTLQHKHMGELKIAGKLNDKLKLGIGVRNDEPLLLDVFEKAVSSIDASVKQEILNKYVSVKFEKAFDYKLFYQVLAGASIIFILALFRYIQVIKYNKVLQEKQDSLNKTNEELHVTQEQLQLSINEFSILLDSTIEAICVFENKICIDVNQVMLKMFEYKSKEEVLGKYLSEFVFSKDLNNIENKDELNSYEVCGLKRSGDIFDIMVKGTNTVLKGKEVRILSIVDISEMKHKEKILLQQSKMASMGEMIDNIAHQWRQPLSVISTVSTGLELSIKLGIFEKDEASRDLKKLNRTSQYLSQTIDDFRNFFKTNKNMVEFSVLRSLKKNLLLLEGMLKNYNINIIFQKDEDAVIKNFENELTQALMNIFQNAKDAFENKTQTRLIFINLEKCEQFITIKIKDNAGGIKDDVIENVFEPYFTTKHQSQGTGIGLYMTHQIIEKHMAGSIFVENTNYMHENNSYDGAQFIIKLPLYSTL